MLSSLLVLERRRPPPPAFAFKSEGWQQQWVTSSGGGVGRGCHLIFIRENFASSHRTIRSGIEVCQTAARAAAAKRFAKSTTLGPADWSSPLQPPDGSEKESRACRSRPPRSWIVDMHALYRSGIGRQASVRPPEGLSLAHEARGGALLSVTARCESSSQRASRATFPAQKSRRAPLSARGAGEPSMGGLHAESVLQELTASSPINVVRV